MNNSDNEVILFGDSVFFGIGATARKNSCYRLLKRMIDLHVILKAKAQDTLREGLLRLERDVFNNKNTRLVLIMFGNNDCRLTEDLRAIVPPDEYKNLYNKMICKIKENGKRPVIVGLQPVNLDVVIEPSIAIIKNKMNLDEWHAKYDEIAKECAREQNIDYIGIKEQLRKEHISQKDGLHPNDAGHAVIAEMICDYLRTMKWK